MTKSQLAKNLNVTTHTLKNWEESKPELIRLINLGLHADQIIKENDQFNRRLQTLNSQLSDGELHFPKKTLDYWNPRDFDEDRVMEICRLLSSNSTEVLKDTILEAMKDKDIWGGTYDRIKSQTSKKIIFEEFGKFLREMEMEMEEDDYHGQGRYIVFKFNDNFYFNFSEKDIDIHQHIVTMYEVYNSRYKIEDK